MKSTSQRRVIFLLTSLLGIFSLNILFAEKANAQRRWNSPPNHYRNPTYHNHYQHQHRHWQPRHVAPYARGYRLHCLPPNYVHLRYGGYHYSYADGVFVRPHGAAFIVTAPPIGIRVNILPPVYTRLYVNAHPYFYYNGTYYNQVNRDEYEVVNPPVGARVSELPDKTSTVAINSQKYYIFDDTYYREIISQDNEIFYEVVSRDEVEYNPMAQNGARFPALPYDAKTVVLAGQKYYLSKGVYYQEIIDNGRIMYEIVGKE